MKMENFKYAVLDTGLMTLDQYDQETWSDIKIQLIAESLTMCEATNTFNWSVMEHDRIWGRIHRTFGKINRHITNKVVEDWRDDDIGDRAGHY